MNLKEKFLKSGLALLLSNSVLQFTSLLTNAILARLLLPSDFGVVALATSFMGLIDVILSVGLGSAIIYQREIKEIQLSTTYWLNFLLAIFIYLLIFFCAPMVSSFYGENILVEIIRLSSLSIIISPFFLVHQKLNERKLNHTLVSKITIFCSLFSGFIAVIIAFYGFGLYALIMKQILNVAPKIFLYRIFSNWEPSFVFDFKEVKEMIWYSLKVKLSQIIFYFERNVDYLIIGKFFSASLLGSYAFAYSLMYLPVQRLSYVVSEVLFPALSTIQSNKKEIRKILLSSIHIIALITFPLMMIISFNASFIIINIFGGKWLPAVSMVQILSFAGAIQSVSQPFGIVFKSIGKPEIGIYYGLLRTLLIVFAVSYGSYLHSLDTVVRLILLAKAIYLAFITHKVHSYLKFDFIQFIVRFKGMILVCLALFFTEVSFNFIYISSGFQFLIQFIVFIFLNSFMHKDIAISLYKKIISKNPI